MIGIDTNVLLRWLVRDQLIGEPALAQSEALSALFDKSEEAFFINEIVSRNGCRTTMTFDKAASKSSHFTELTR